MFNVYLPKLLETRLGRMSPGGPVSESSAASPSSSLIDSLWDVVVYSIGGCPGAIVNLDSLLCFRKISCLLYIAWCLSRRVIVGTTVVTRREHIHLSIFLHHLRTSERTTRIESEYCGHQLECFGMLKKI
jgi:hypothetical protein